MTPAYPITISFLNSFLFFFFNAPATTEIYTLSLHDALPIYRNPAALPLQVERHLQIGMSQGLARPFRPLDHHESRLAGTDRKSTRLNSSHSQISYAVFCLKKKKNKITK